jgi:hypothetical protein
MQESWGGNELARPPNMIDPTISQEISSDDVLTDKLA